MSAALSLSLRAVCGRFALLYAAWVAMAGTAPLDLAAGLPAAALSAWVSLVLLPPGPHRLPLTGIARLALRFAAQSLLAGIEVARLALDPRLRIRPRHVTCRAMLAPGLKRDVFLAMASLQPGSLPLAQQADGTVLLHVLDARAPVAARFAAEEARFAAALGQSAAAWEAPRRG